MKAGAIPDCVQDQHLGMGFDARLILCFCGGRGVGGPLIPMACWRGPGFAAAPPSPSGRAVLRGIVAVGPLFQAADIFGRRHLSIRSHSPLGMARRAVVLEAKGGQQPLSGEDYLMRLTRSQKVYLEDRREVVRRPFQISADLGKGQRRCRRPN